MCALGRGRGRRDRDLGGCVNNFSGAGCTLAIHTHASVGEHATQRLPLGGRESPSQRVQECFVMAVTHGAADDSRAGASMMMP